MELQNFYNRSRLSEEQQDLIVRILSEDLSTDMAEMARLTGIPYTTIRGAYKHLGISTRDILDAKALKRQTEIMLKVEPLYSAGLGRQAIADELGVSLNAVVKVCKKFGLKKGRTPRHGTATEYGHFGCRCDECIEANRIRCGQVKASMRERVEDAPHGTQSGYWNWECRCDACRKVGAEINKMRVATPLETQWNKGARWVGPEDAAIESYDLVARELAVTLGRSVGGVNARRAGRGVRKKEIAVLTR